MSDGKLITLGDKYRSKAELERMIDRAMKAYAILQKISGAMMGILAEVNRMAAGNAVLKMQSPSMKKAWNEIKNMTDAHAEAAKGMAEYERSSGEAGKPVPDSKS